jgi:hypothetical protein
MVMTFRTTTSFTQCIWNRCHIAHAILLLMIFRNADGALCPGAPTTILPVPGAHAAGAWWLVMSPGASVATETSSGISD